MSILRCRGKEEEKWTRGDSSSALQLFQLHKNRTWRRRAQDTCIFTHAHWVGRLLYQRSKAKVLSVHICPLPGNVPPQTLHDAHSPSRTRTLGKQYLQISMPRCKKEKYDFATCLFVFFHARQAEFSQAQDSTGNRNMFLKRKNLKAPTLPGC